MQLLGGAIPAVPAIPDRPPVEIAILVDARYVEQCLLREQDGGWHAVRLLEGHFPRRSAPALPWALIAERTWPGNPVMAVRW